MTFFKKIFSILPLLALVFTLIFAANTALAQDGTVVEVINSSEDHTIFAELLSETNLDEAISAEGPFTVVAPTDAAFEELGDEFDAIKEEPDQLQNIVIGHLFQGEITSADAEPALGVTITEGDIPASNGLVHITDQVIQ